MKPREINIQRAALFGLFFGIAFGVFDNFADIGSAPTDTIILLSLGGGFGGAMLFVGAAAIANLFRK